MYRPPQNTNIVKSIKSKFENIENKPPENSVSKNGSKTHFQASKKPQESSEGKQILQRQISDPLKRNIKRTPAFRVDKSVERTNGFQRNSYNRSTLFENKVKQFSAVKHSCDNNSNLIPSESTNVKTEILKDVSKNVPKTRPILIKSKSSHDFQYIRNKFDKGFLNDSQRTNSTNLSNGSHESLVGVDLSLLYTEPIPKFLRNKNIPGEPSSIKIPEPQIENIYNITTLKVGEKKEIESLQNNSTLVNSGNGLTLTDTLKVALKKPLPKGPAPKKPPRTFQHSKCEDHIDDLKKNISFLHVHNQVDRKIHAKPKSSPKKEKADPKYMLNKLETALRNNKLRARSQAKTDISTTSGEDSDDSLLFRSKTNRTLPRLPSQNSEYNTSAFNFNCLNALSCSVSNYEKIKEPNSSFFVASTEEEPVYAEPYHYRKDSVSNSAEVRVKRRVGSTRSEKSTRNSLYYMSTPVLSGEVIMDKNECSTSQQEDTKPKELKLSNSVNRQISAENSSLSSFTSDLDSTPSPMEENSKIKSIIECYESRSTYKDAYIEESSKNVSNTCFGHTDSTNHRVENLRSALCQTLDKSFTYDSAMRDSDSENNDNSNKVPDIIKKFETYIKGRPKYCKPKIHKDSLFYCCLIIEKVRDVAQIKFQYPNCVELPQNLESLCFPESNSTVTHITNAAQTYTLLITNDKGERTYGYCRRVLPEGGLQCLPLAYCILSKYRALRFYKKILVELESRHGLPNKFRDELISQFYNQKFPKPGDSIKINLTNIEPNTNKTDNKENLEESVDLVSFVHVNKTGEYGCINKVKKTSNLEQIFVNVNDIKNSCAIPSFVVENKDSMELVLTLHPDTRYEDSDLKRLHELPIDILLKVFSSMLLERKVVLISTMISKLSSCIDSLQSILYPFTWHHTFIPILPENLWDIVESPTPVICGVLSNEVLEDRTIENGIVVDLDNRIVQREEGDENKILSGSMQRLWKRSIALANKAAASMDYVHSVYLSDAYLQVFILCFKDYKKFFVDGVFQKEEFINHGKTKGIRRFLRMFTETYMFLAFLDTVANNPENLTEFDKKIEMYGSEDSKIILEKLFEWNNK